MDNNVLVLGRHNPTPSGENAVIIIVKKMIFVPVYSCRHITRTFNGSGGRMLYNRILSEDMRESVMMWFVNFPGPL